MLHYETVTIADLSDMAHIFKNFLNDGDNVTNYLRTGLEMPGYIGVKCMDDDRTVAVLTARPGIDFTYPKPELEKAIAARWAGKNIYSGEMVTVLPEYRGKGIARSMTLLWADRMREAGGDYLLLELWDKKSGDEPASGMIKYIGALEQEWVFTDFYKDLHLYGMSCPDCGKGNPCTCGATVAMIALWPVPLRRG